MPGSLNQGEGSAVSSSHCSSCRDVRRLPNPSIFFPFRSPSLFRQFHPEQFLGSWARSPPESPQASSPQPIRQSAVRVRFLRGNRDEGGPVPQAGAPLPTPLSSLHFPTWADGGGGGQPVGFLPRKPQSSAGTLRGSL